MAAPIANISNQAKYYLSLSHEEANTKGKSEEVALSIFKTLETMASSKKRKETTQLLNVIQGSKSPQKETLIEALIKQSTPYPWKGALVGGYVTPLALIKRPFLKYSNHLEEEIIFNKRFSLIENEECATLFGSSFATNKEGKRETEGHSLLDAAIAQKCHTKKGKFTGYAFALADGAGGHFGDLLQDQRISQVALSSVKECVKHLASHATSETLKDDLLPLLETVKQKAEEKGKGEGATLLSCRAFPVHGGYLLMGFNIGDGILFAYDPKKQKLLSLLPSHQSAAGIAIFPVSYRSFEIHQIETFIPNGTLLFLASDGLHDLLPYTEEENTYPNELKYRKRTLKKEEIETLFKLLPEKASPQDYLKALIDKGLQTLNHLREDSLKQENIQMGDDVSALCCMLNQEKASGPFSNIKNTWSQWL